MIDSNHDVDAAVLCSGLDGGADEAERLPRYACKGRGICLNVEDGIVLDSAVISVGKVVAVPAAAVVSEAAVARDDAVEGYDEGLLAAVRSDLASDSSAPGCV